MPASMIIAPAGFIRNVSGSSIAIVAGGPSPGMIPTTVPSTTPTKHHSRFAGCSATAKPCIRPETISTLGKRNAEREREQDVARRARARTRSPRTRLFFVGLLAGLALRLRLLVATLRHDLADGAAGSAELHRHHAGVADDLAAQLADLGFGDLHVFDLDREVVDARPLSRRLRLRRLRAGVVLDQRDVDHAVGEMARGMVAHLLGVDLGEAEHLAVELGGALEVVDLQRQMDDSVHGFSQF